MLSYERKPIVSVVFKLISHMIKKIIRLSVKLITSHQ